MAYKTRLWLHSAAAAGINGFASGFVLVMADPATFNLQNPSKLLLTALCFAAFGVCSFLKTAPLPDPDPVPSMPSIAPRSVRKAPARKKKAATLAVLLAASLAFSPACAGLAPATNTPTVDSVTATRQMAVRIADETTFALDLSTQALSTADDLQKAGLISADALRTIATAGKKFGQTARVALQQLGSVTANPSLKATSQVVLDDLEPLLASMEKSGNDKLSLVATSLRLGTKVLQTYLRGTT